MQFHARRTAPRRPGRIRVAVPLLATLLTASLLSGCLGGSSRGAPRPGDGSGPRSVEAPGGDLLLEPGRGAIVGFVLNAEGAWIAGAHVLVVGGPFTSADAQGRFVFRNLDPARHVLRASADAYRALEQEVVVESDLVTNVDLVLQSSLDLGPNSREHFHDFWQDATEKPLYSGDVEWPAGILDGARESTLCAGRTTGAGAGAAKGDPKGCAAEFFLGDLDGDNLEEIVWPGTGAIDVTVTWKAQPWVKHVLFQYQSANGTHLFSGAELQSGESHTIVLERNMTDHGHQAFSVWRFRIRADLEPVDGVPLLVQNDLIRLLVGPFHVEMTAHRGTLHPEPPHPRFWAQGPRIPLTDGLLHLVEEGPRIERDATQLTDSNESIGFLLPAGKIVPPGTTQLEATLEYWSDTPGVDLDGVWSKKTLAFRPAATHPRQATLNGLRADDPVERQDPSGGSHGRLVWHLPVEGREADVFYQTGSLWLFLLANEGEEHADTFTNECGGGLATGGVVCAGMHYRLSATAINDRWTPELAQVGEP